MKVGVLTLPQGKNYGGNLQAFALTQTLRGLGHSPVLINLRKLPKNGSVVPGSSKPGLTGSSSIPKTIPNHSFVEKYTGPFTQAFFTSEQLKDGIGDYELDAVVVGSDQVWRPRFTQATALDYFLDFLPEGDNRTRRISYAASFGVDKWEFTQAQTRTAAALLAKFDAVSVREDRATKLCKNRLGIEAQHVLDPTMLLTAERYAELTGKPPVHSGPPRLLTYILDQTDDKVDVVRTMCGALSAEAFATDGHPFGPTGGAGEEPRDKSVERWLTSFQQADYVVTDSFHGAVFSILFNKPFIAYGNPKRGMSRFLSLLRMFDLENQLITSSSRVEDGSLLSTPIDWARVNTRLDELREMSLGFLRQALDAPQSAAADMQTDQDDAAVPAQTTPEDPTEAEAWLLARRDNERFSRALGQEDQVNRARAHLMFAAHAIEKGLSHSDFRPGFGQKRVKKIGKIINDWIDRGNSIEDPFFKATVSVMRAYFERHDALGFDTTEYWGYFSDNVKTLIDNADLANGGVLPAQASREVVPSDGAGRSFLDVVYARRSIREWEDIPIPDAAIRTAVQIASQAPSVCNRQGARVHHFKDPAKIAALVDLQGGFNGYSKPPGLLLVTCDLLTFVQSNERNQAFIDGGLFMMSLLLGLENMGLGTCCLNTAMNARQENRVRKIANIPDTEVLIAFIAIGKHQGSVLTPRSLRFPAEEILVEHQI